MLQNKNRGDIAIQDSLRYNSETETSGSEIKFNSDNFVTSIDIEGNFLCFHYKKLIQQSDSPWKKYAGTSILRWQSILDFAGVKDMEILIVSFHPGSLQNVANPNMVTFLEQTVSRIFTLLYRRYCLLNKNPESGLLIVLDGKLNSFSVQIEAQVIEMAHVNQIDACFFDWVENCNLFVAMEDIGTYTCLLV